MSDPRLYEWLTLRRIHEGGMAKSAGVYLDHGRPVPHHVTGMVDELTWAGLVSVGDGDPIWGLRRLGLTSAGQARYEALARQRHRVTLPVPPAEFGTRMIDRTTTGGRHRG